MITRDHRAFLTTARECAPNFGAPTARAAFLVAPDGFARAAESATDNRYMAAVGAFDARAAADEHRALHAAMATTLPTVCFPGLDGAPDGVFPNNVYATVPGRLIVGRMRHAVRRREAERPDIRAFFAQVLDYAEQDLSRQPHACELTGALVVDRARGLGFCGLSERCDEAGARLMHEAFGLRATLMFDLAPGEYHTNVVLAVLAGRAALICGAGFADVAAAEAIDALYAPHAIRLDPAAQRAYAANAIALSPETAWMSAGAAAALRGGAHDALAAAGFRVVGVPLGAVEAAGGSLRCCVAEIF